MNGLDGNIEEMAVSTDMWGFYLAQDDNRMKSTCLKPGLCRFVVQKGTLLRVTV